MNFTFNELKTLFNNYNLKKDIYGQYYILNRNTGIPYNDGLVIDYVKFSYDWIHITRYSRNLKRIDSIIIEESDYNYAFSDELKVVYDNIMNYSRQSLESTGEMISKENLIECLKQNGINKEELLNIIEIIYTQEDFYQFYEIWLRYSTNNPHLYPIKTKTKRISN